LPLNRQSAKSTFKKVVVLRLDRNHLPGYLDPVQLGAADTIDLLTLEGEHQALPLNQVKSIYFVREFNEPFELERKAYLSRPRQEGLWVRLRFTDGDQFEGVVPNDLLTLLDHGIQITPPDLNGNSLRVFIPRAALAEFLVLGVVGQSRRARPAAPAPTPQRGLFEPPVE
jgi:hypothetical protein